MPHATDYDAAADLFDTTAAEVEQVTQHLSHWPTHDAVQGGRLGLHIESVMSHTLRRCHHISAQWRDLAATCRWRAEVCRTAEATWNSYLAAQRRYSADLSSWNVANHRHNTEPDVWAEPGRPPRPPARPSPAPRWAEW